MARFLIRVMDAQAAWAAPLGEALHRLVSAIFRPIRPLKDLLNGTWLGHPVHAALSDLPIGLFAGVVLLDILNERPAADAVLVLGILGMLAAAVAGLADYADTDGAPRVRATLHATLMVTTLVVYAVSLAIRAGGPVDRALPVGLSIIGFVLLSAGAFVGGDIVFAHGNMVSRHAWRTGGSKWNTLEVGEVAEGVPTRAKLGANTLVLVRQGATIYALHDQCAHAGGPLSGGTIVDGCIECPWHGSRFRLADGRLARGPAVYDQPSYEVREVDGGLEARRVPR